MTQAHRWEPSGPEKNSSYICRGCDSEVVSHDAAQAHTEPCPGSKPKRVVHRWEREAGAGNVVSTIWRCAECGALREGIGALTPDINGCLGKEAIHARTDDHAPWVCAVCNADLLPDRRWAGGGPSGRAAWEAHPFRCTLPAQMSKPAVEARPVCATPGCGREIRSGGEGHSEICSFCLACLELHGNKSVKPAYEEVDHPKHYNDHPSGVECIAVVEHLSFNVGSAVKYLWRAGLKPGQTVEKDLRKAIWHIEREILRLRTLATKEKL